MLTPAPSTTQYSRHSRLQRQNHHHHDRPSRQFVATTSSAIFGDWDIDIKIDRRTLARLRKSEVAVAEEEDRPKRLTTKATISAGNRGSSGGGSRPGGKTSLTLGPGPGVHTGASGMQPLSALTPTISTSTTLSQLTAPTSTALFTSKEQSPANIANYNKTVNTPFSKSPAATFNVDTVSAGGSQEPNEISAQSTIAAASMPSGSKVQDVSSAPAAPSARSSFLKALGKFKSKHLLQQKRSSAPPTIPPSDISTNPVDRRASYVLPPIQINDQYDNPASTTLESSPEASTQTTHHVQFEDSLVPEGLTPDGTSSLRLKLKNRMSSTLASMKSSSSLREKAKAQQHASNSEPTQSTSKSNERRQSAFVTFSSSTDVQQQQGVTNSNVSASTISNSSKNRQSKGFWTFPRVRLESSQQGTKHQTSSFDTLATTSTTAAATKTSTSMSAHDDLTAEDITMSSTAGDGTTSLHEQLEGLKVEELDSDQSLDIILPIDYEDYTQFAELPLKKRKKKERSLAAAAAAAAVAANGDQSGKRDSSVRASAEAMKRFLTLQRKDSSTPTTTLSDAAEEAANEKELNASGNSKKRPPSSTESRGSVAKRTGQHASEWRRSILKSLHLGKNQQVSNKSTASATSTRGSSSQANDLSLTTKVEQHQNSSAGVDMHPIAESVRPSRSESVVSIRSRSLTTSTHPALLATTIAKPRTPGLRRETLEMAMRRRRQSSVARSNISDTDIPSPLPRSSNFFNLEDYSSTNVTHTFTSFTLELADMYARDIVNNSATPGLFNFKRRQSRLTVSSHFGMDIDTDPDFRGFDSDGDAISGYTGDADISMEEIHVRPKSPTTFKPATGLFKTRTRESNAVPTDVFPRRKISSVDGDSDTVPELPSLTIRTRDLNRSSGGFSNKPRPVSGSSFEMDYDQLNNSALAESTSPRSPRRTGAMSPAFQRKTSRGMMTLNSVAEDGSNVSSLPSPTSKSFRGTPMSMQEVVSWKPKNMYSQQQQHSSRPFVPALDTKPLKTTRGSGLSSSTTLVPSSRTPHSASVLSQSPRALSPTYESFDPSVADSGLNRFDSVGRHHQQFSSTSSSYRNHPSHPSADTLVTGHPKAESNMSTGSSYSGRTLSGYGQQLRHGITTLDVEEFDPSEDFPPTTPADLKSMDFEALLATAEREHQKGWDELKLQKKVSGQPKIPPVFPSLAQQPPPAPSTQASFSPIKPLKIANSASKTNRQTTSSNLAPPQRASVAFDLGPSDDGGTGTGTGTGSDRSVRSKRVMKKKTSVIRLTGNGTGNIQGRREDDGVIRVSMSPTPYSSSNSPSPLLMHRELTHTRPEMVDSLSSTSRSYSQQQWRQ
ncbi:hypothetical protein FBU30_002225 [Linnemannia zychae]|nr:hypothetical protein FBU30_002225 [Linnemannia zychae]